MSDRPRCPHCNSPDLAPYKMQPGPFADAYRSLYPNAVVCVDCERITVDVVKANAPRVDLAALKLATPGAGTFTVSRDRFYRLVEFEFDSALAARRLASMDNADPGDEDSK